jgi:hypothetical protein
MQLIHTQLSIATYTFHNICIHYIPCNNWVLIHCLAMHMMTMSTVAFRGRLIWSSSCSLDHGRFSIASGVNVMFITVRLLDEPVSRMLEIEFLKRGESVAKEIPVSTIVQDTHSI